MNIETVLGNGLAGVSIAGAGVVLPLIAAIIAYFQYESTDRESKPIIVSTESLLLTYDFIVVGADSAGSVVASRLSQIENLNVPLLEAGGDEMEISRIFDFR